MFEAHGWLSHAMDLRPAGIGPGPARFADYRAQLESEASAMRGVVLVGASLGGLLSLAASATAKASALVLVNPMPPSPWHALVTRTADYPDVVPWGDARRIEGTIDAMQDSDEAARLFSFRRWRNESGVVLNEARAGIQLAVPLCPLLVIASDDDEEVPCSASREVAAGLNGNFLNVPGRHLAPLMGRAAADCAWMAVDWLNARLGFTTR